MRTLVSGLLIIVLSLCSSLTVQAQKVYEPEDSLTVLRLLKTAPQGATVMHFARQFLGCPYVGHTLEASLDDEPLVINLRQLDCTTLVETVAALWHTHREGVEPRLQFQTYCDHLTRYRYWQGKRQGYLSRHHYFSWWWHDCVAQGLLSEVDLSSSGAALTPLNVKLNYMSLHPSAYRQLAAHPEWIAALQPLEQQYSVRDGVYLSQEELLRVGSAALRNIVAEGDVIAIVTSKGGLDYSHLGFASWQSDGRLHLLNASSIHHKVVDEPKTLYRYLAEHPSSIGIRVFRILPL